MRKEILVGVAVLTGLGSGLAAMHTSQRGGPVAPRIAASERPAKAPIALVIARLNSPNQDDRPAGSPIDMIIIHDTETPAGIRQAKTVANHFLNPRSKASSHYVIGKAGEILQLVPDERRAWHVGPSHFQGRSHLNDYAIGIELVNTDSGHDPYTTAQYDSLIALTADLVARHHIALGQITGHKDVTDYPSYRKDPAPNFDWQRLFTGVKQTLETRTITRSEP